MNFFEIEGKKIGGGHPTYFIADIAANHDGDLEKAKDLIYSCAEAGAHAAKFQNFRARSIVSDHGFKSLQGKLSHQAAWKKSVYEVYQEAELPMEWTETLKETCKKAGVHYFTSPYSPKIIDEISPHVSAWKMGSGDITWHNAIQHMAKTDKPFILSTGACDIKEVKAAVNKALDCTKDFALLQCNTNYTANTNEDRSKALERMKSINLKVLSTYKKEFPGIVLGLSDHTLGHTTVAGSVGLFDAKIIEKHYTLDNSSEGPDHPFSMNPETWKEMVDITNIIEEQLSENLSFEQRLSIIKPYIDLEELTNALGDGVKRVEDNEKETVKLQRRGICAGKDLPVGHTILDGDLTPLRPQLEGCYLPYQEHELIGKKLKIKKVFGETIFKEDITNG